MLFVSFCQIYFSNYRGVSFAKKKMHLILSASCFITNSYYNFYRVYHVVSRIACYTSHVCLSEKIVLDAVNESTTDFASPFMG